MSFADLNVGFLVDFAAHGIFQRFPGFNKARQCRETPFRPTDLASEQAGIFAERQYDDCRIQPGETASSAIIRCAMQDAATVNPFILSAAYTAESMPLAPLDHALGVGEQGGIRCR